jgi:predicted Zn-dependent protease
MISSPGQGSSAALSALFGSFRTLSAEEAARLRPRQVQVVVPRAGDTAESLAGRMASDHPLQHFLMLNARQPGQPLAPGEPVKIVTWARP